MTATPKLEKLPGTRPEGALDERQAAAHVQQMFSRIAPRYDFLNHFLSFSLDRVWRYRTAKRFAHIMQRPEAQILDLCCGTGDLAFALAKRRAKLIGGNSTASGPVIGCDFVESMLTRAADKARAGGYHAAFGAADSMQLPFANGKFDLITTAFGFRNLANYEKGLREFARVLKPGGEIGILEFSEPESGPLAEVFRFYFRHVLPRIGGAISGNDEAYKYLPSSVSKFPGPQALAELMRATGFDDVRIASWNFGSVLLHSARRR